MRRLRIDHLTEYRFGAPVTLLPHRMLLRPRESHQLRIASSTLEITPQPSIHWQRDVLDNSVALVNLTEVTEQLRIMSSVVIEHYEETPLDFTVEDYAVTYPFNYLAAEALVLAPFRVLTWGEDGLMLEKWLKDLGLRVGGIETFVLIDRMNRAIHDGFRYQAREEPGVQSPAQTLANASGSCRDFAALLMDACRQLGLASRFVSGYLHDPVTETKAGATHAWTEVYLPGPGWKGFDPTCGEVTGTHHIPVAVAYHPEKVPPVAGEFVGPADQRATLLVDVRVNQLPD